MNGNRQGLQEEPSDSFTFELRDRVGFSMWFVNIALDPMAQHVTCLTNNTLRIFTGITRRHLETLLLSFKTVKTKLRLLNNGTAFLICCIFWRDCMKEIDVFHPSLGKDHWFDYSDVVEVMERSFDQWRNSCCCLELAMTCDGETYLWCLTTYCWGVCSLKLFRTVKLDVFRIPLRLVV